MRNIGLTFSSIFYSESLNDIEGSLSLPKHGDNPEISFS